MKDYIALAVVFVLHLVGLFGLNSNYREIFEALTALNLLLAFVAVYIFHEGNRQARFYFFITAFSCGMLVEIIGVQSGFPFGDYYYTKLLSISFMDVPLIIGVNWFILSYGLIALFNNVVPRANSWLKSAVAAMSMTFMDVLIEPFAIKHKLWVWVDNSVPFENYLSWFFISFVLFKIGFVILPEERNKVAVGVVCIFFAFFSSNILLN